MELSKLERETTVRAELTEAQKDEMARVYRAVNDQQQPSASAMERARAALEAADTEENPYLQEMAARRHVASAILTAEEAAAAKARTEAIEECADFVLRITHAEDDSDISEKLAVAFDDSSRHRPIIKRLQNYGEVLADNLRALATKPPQGEMEGGA